jgi:alpha-glucosidase
MTRAAYAGAQRYASSWTGDNIATWDHLRLSLSMVLNLGLSGIPLTGPDVGGFAGTPDGELFARWMQLGSMLPYFRVHSAKGKPPQEPWSYGELYESINRKTLERRYQLLPYLYSAVAQCAQDGTPIARPMFMADPGDPALRDLDDQFMLGDALLVAPVLEPGSVDRKVYLPRGVWYEYATGRMIDGARQITAAAPLDALPLYARAGQVIPLWPVMQHTGEQPLDELRLRVYAGNGESTVYEDAGEGLAYQQGDYRWSYFTCKFLASGQFALEWRRTGRYQPAYQQVRVEIVGISGEPQSVMLDGQGAPVWYYESGIVELVAGTFDDAHIIGQGGESGPAEDTLLHPPGRST